MMLHMVLRLSLITFLRECDVFFTKAKAHCPSCLCLDNWAYTYPVNFGYLDCSRLDFTEGCCIQRGTFSSVRTDGGWHKPDCARPEHTFVIDKLGSWVFLEFRPTCRLSTTEQNAGFFPPLTDVRRILSDVSLQRDCVKILGFVCLRHLKMAKCSLLAR